MAEVNTIDLYNNLPDNSKTNRNKQKEETTDKTPVNEKRAEKVVHGKVKTKKNEMRNLANVFISEDTSNVKNYIIMDVIVPAVKKTLYDLVVGALDITLYGGRGSGKRPSADKVSYRDYNSISKSGDRSYGGSRTTSGYSYDDVVVETRGEAEAVLSRMDEIMEEYEIVRVADLYDLVGITGDYTDNKYGWTNIRNASIVRVNGGYKINMPRALPIR